MKDFWIVWFYCANYGRIKLPGTDPKQAADSVYAIFSEDFKEKGTILVFDHEPVLVTLNGQEIRF